METIRIGVNALIEKDGKMLFGLRKGTTRGAGTWGLPGGRLEFGEKVEDAIRREMMEETGLILDEIEFMSIVNNPRGSEHYIQINFLVKKYHGELRNLEPDKCEEWQWFEIGKWPEPLFFGHKYVIRQYGQKNVLMDVVES